MTTYKDVGDIRKENLARILADYNGSYAAFAREYGLNAAVLTQIKNDTTKKYRMGPGWARELENKLGLPAGWMDHEHTPGLTEEALGLAAVFDRLPEEKKELFRVLIGMTKNDVPKLSTFSEPPETPKDRSSTKKRIS